MKYLKRLKATCYTYLHYRIMNLKGVQDVIFAKKSGEQDRDVLISKGYHHSWVWIKIL